MKFREITLKSGTKFLLGKDEDSNDELIKKFKGKSNIIIHTVAPGSPFCVIEKQVFTGDVQAAAAITARYSQDWRDNKSDVKVSLFTGKDVSKSKSAKPGTWTVKKSKIIKVKKEDILNLIR